MTIIHPFNDFLFELFPKADKTVKDINILTREIEAYYSWGNIKPTVTIDNQLVTIQIDTDLIQSQDKDFQKVIALCEKGRYNEAKPILLRLIKTNHTISEYHRVLGQILSEQGQNEEAINSLIDALKWNPKNESALIMMGNIFFRNLKDTQTALTYFKEVMSRNPENALAYNNIGSALLQMGKLEESIHYLELAWEKDKTYPNTTYGLAYAYEKFGDNLKAFEWATECLKQTAGKNKQLYALSLEIIKNALQAITTKNDGSSIFEEFKDYLQRRSGLEIRDMEDNTISTTAKLEMAEYYNRNYHLIKFKPGHEFLSHLKMHEMVHLDLVLDARDQNINKVFLATGEQKALFFRNYKESANTLRKVGLSEEKITGFMTSLFDGINLQIYNSPIDLFIEDFLYKNYQDLRPYQFASIYHMLMEGKKGVEETTGKKYVPIEIYKASKVLNILNAIHFKDLFGLDIVQEFNPTPLELKEANQFWNEFKEYREDKEPGEEYELIEHWGKDLNLDRYFELMYETDYNNRPKNLEEFMESMQDDPFGLNVDRQFKDEQHKDFLKGQAKIGTNMAVTLFMVDALQYFENFDTEKIKRIALDIAMAGTQGFNPDKENYSIPSIEGKTFSGYHILAYYYVSFKLAIPELLKELQLPFDEEYKLARLMYKCKRTLFSVSSKVEFLVDHLIL